MTSSIERIKAAIRRYGIIGRNHATTKKPEWFIDDDELPAGEFVAGPFPSLDKAEDELYATRAREARRIVLGAAMIAIAELPGPEHDDWDTKLRKISKFEALQLGHSMGLLAACQYLRAAIERAPGGEG